MALPCFQLYPPFGYRVSSSSPDIENKVRQLTQRHPFDLGTCASLVLRARCFLPLIDGRHIGFVRGRPFVLEPNGP